MQIQPVINQPSFNGKFIFKEKAEKLNNYTPDQLSRIFSKVTALVSEKPYDVFMYRNKDNPEFFNISANKSFEEAKKIKEYTVKIHSKAVIESIIDAANEAIDMYEKYITKSFK